MIERMQATVMVNGQHPGTVQAGWEQVWGYLLRVRLWEGPAQPGRAKLAHAGGGTGGNEGSAIHQPTQK